MTALNEALNEFDVADSVSAEHGLSARAAKTIMRFFAVEPGFLAKQPEFGMAWFHDQYSDFPIRLEVRRERMDLAKIFLTTIKTRAWKTYVSVLEEYDFDRVGVIMSSHNQRLHVFHNWWNLSQAPGYTRMVRRAASGDSGVVFESLESLLQAIKLQGWTP